jgi:hypothetical protein
MHFFCSILCFPWWGVDLAFHALVRLKGPNREGLLVDCGAITNLAGDKWVKRAADIAAIHGQGTLIVDTNPQNVEGVGTGASKITQRATVPVCLASGSVGDFQTQVVQDSELPALLGLEGLERNRALIDVTNQRMIYVGPGGYELKLSPGSVVMQLEKVASGHLLLPASEWSKKMTSPAAANPVSH